MSVRLEFLHRENPSRKQWDSSQLPIENLVQAHSQHPSQDASQRFIHKITKSGIEPIFINIFKSLLWFLPQPYQVQSHSKGGGS